MTLDRDNGVHSLRSLIDPRIFMAWHDNEHHLQATTKPAWWLRLGWPARSPPEPGKMPIFTCSDMMHPVVLTRPSAPTPAPTAGLGQLSCHHIGRGHHLRATTKPAWWLRLGWRRAWWPPNNVKSCYDVCMFVF